MVKPNKRTGDKRAKRRETKEKMKEIARKVYPSDSFGKLAEHLKNCSCFMCGNPRKFSKGRHRRTKQEQIVLDREVMD